jgi:hypothetical protein
MTYLTYYYVPISELQVSNNVLFLGSCRRSNNKNIEVDLCPRHPHQHPLQVKEFYRTFNVLPFGAFSCAFFIGRKGKENIAGSIKFFTSGGGGPGGTTSHSKHNGAKCL